MTSYSRRLLPALALASVGIGCGDPTKPLSSLVITPANPVVIKGMTLRLTARSLENQELTAARWLSSSPTVAQIDSTGLLLALAPGHTTIAVEHVTGAGQVEVTVTASLASVQTKVSTTCGITMGGDVYCWGRNRYGEAGNGAITQALVAPAKVSGNERFNSVSPGYDHTCAVGSSGTYCWGLGYRGAFGTGITFDSSRTPVPVSGGNDFAIVAANGTKGEFVSLCGEGSCGVHTCALSKTNELYCWGETDLAEGGFPSWVLTPTPAKTSSRFSSISLGFDFGCGVTTAGIIQCWGDNLYHQRGLTVSASRSPLSSITGDGRFQMVSAGRNHTCGIDFTGSALCWGANQSGQLGAPATETCHARFIGSPCRATPVEVVTEHKFQSISAGAGDYVESEVKPTSHTCGLTVNQEVYCWGSNSFGQLGNGTLADSPTPVRVAGPLKFMSVTAGLHHSCAVAAGGAAYCWGDNSLGQLGNGTTTNSHVPVPVTGALVFR
jgi:alpha-tubulin suppressor-like RCC1 family protein